MRQRRVAARSYGAVMGARGSLGAMETRSLGATTMSVTRIGLGLAGGAAHQTVVANVTPASFGCWPACATCYAPGMEGRAVAWTHGRRRDASASARVARPDGPGTIAETRRAMDRRGEEKAGDLPLVP